MKGNSCLLSIDIYAYNVWMIRKDMMLAQKPNSGDMYGSLSLGQMSSRQL